MAQKDDSSSILGIGTVCIGDINVDGLFRVDGDFKGSIRISGTLILGQRARVHSTIQAQRAIISGIVKGNVYIAHSLQLLSGAFIVGNIFTPALCTEDNVIIHGDICVTGKPNTSESDMSEFIRSNGDSKRFLGAFSKAISAMEGI